MRSLNLRRSTNVAGATYDEETRVLTVTFVRGSTYEYVVGPDVVDGLEASPSPGNYMKTRFGGGRRVG